MYPLGLFIGRLSIIRADVNLSINRSTPTHENRIKPLLIW